MANEGMPDLSSLIGEVMRDPAKLAQLQGLAASLGLNAPASPSPEAPSAPPAQVAPTSPTPPMPDLGALLPLLGGRAPSFPALSRHTALLRALRPYLSEPRQAMIDTIVSLGKLGGMLGGGGDTHVQP